MSDASVESSKQGSVYGLMAEFDTPQELLTAARRLTTRATSRSMLSVRSRSKDSPTRSDFTRTAFRWWS